ncbi:MAG: hypothetical protein FWH52_00705 [Synergistaceae bacterium]|nr:hypothetical protein [Synergistaceae bacterium]
MMERVIDTNSLQTYLFSLIPTKKVCVRENDDGIINLIPVREPQTVGLINVGDFMKRKRDGQLPECISEIFGMFSSSNDDTLDKFMERRHADKELDL